MMMIRNKVVRGVAAGVLALALAAPLWADSARNFVATILATTCAASQWVNAIAASGAATCAQPAIASLSDSASVVTPSSTNTLTNKTLDSAGTGNTLQISGVTVSRGQIPATSTNDDATAGNIGQCVTVTVASGATVGLSDNAAKTVMSISLPAGDWQVSGKLHFAFGATTSVNTLAASISQTNDTLDQTADHIGYAQFGSGQVLGSAAYTTVPVTPLRQKLSGTTTVYLVGFSHFTPGTMAAWGYLQGCRPR